MSSSRKYPFEARDFNILSNVCYGVGGKLPQLADSRASKVTLEPDSQKTYLRNACSVDYNPISQLKNTSPCFRQAFNEDKKKKYLVTKLYQDSDLFSSKYRDDFKQYVDSRRTFGRTRGLFQQYYGSNNSSHNRVFGRNRC